MRRFLLLMLLPLPLAFSTSAGALTGQGESAKQYVLSAAKALGSARSFRLSGTIKESSGPESVDLVLFSNDDLNGSLTLGGDLVKVTRVDGTDYYQAPPAFWETVGKLPPTLAKSIGPDWISLSNASSSGLGSDFEIAPLASEIRSNSGLKIVGHQQVNGHAAVGVKTSSGSVLWIAVSRTPYPISEVEPGTSTGSGTLSFSGWNSFKLPTPPKRSFALSSLH